MLEPWSVLGTALTRACFLPEGKCTLLLPADKGLPPSKDIISPLVVVTSVVLPPCRSNARALSSLGSCTSDLMPLILCLLFPEPVDEEEEEELDEDEEEDDEPDL